uniref:REP-associated tyrosine transposase n=1 Tax=Pseudomonas viridiflava TaxID=33069 RepID=UPI000F06693B
SLAWVVMPDHLHWLFELRTDSIAGVMRRVKSKAAIAVNKTSGCKGRLWQYGYHDKAIRKEQDLIHYARYIVANPMRAGLVGSVKDHPLWDATWI